MVSPLPAFILVPLLYRWSFRPASCGSLRKMRFSSRKWVFQPYSPDLYFLSQLGIGSCPNGDWDGRLVNPYYSLQPRGPIESSHCKITLKITKTLSIKWVLSLFYSLSLVALSHILCLSPKNTPKVLLHYYIPSLISNFMLSCNGWGGGVLFSLNPLQTIKILHTHQLSSIWSSKSVFILILYQ